MDDLRRDGDLVVSLLAEDAGGICGHVALSGLRSPPASLALAPVSVVGTRQRQGIGRALVEQAIAEAKDLGLDMIFVVGEPEYYGRFGFTAALAAEFACPYGGPYFMALALGDGAIVPSEVVYAPACDGLE